MRPKENGCDCGCLPLHCGCCECTIVDKATGADGSDPENEWPEPHTPECKCRRHRGLRQTK